MKILIVAATEQEINPLLNNLRSEKRLNDRLINCFFEEKSIDVLITGVGMISTAYWLTKTLSHTKYDFILNLGIAGSFDRSIALASVVNVAADFFSELGAEDGEDFLTLSQLKLVDENHPPYVNNRLVNSLEINSSILKALPKVSGITVNRVHGNEVSINNVIKMFNPQTESMEGAAFLFVCLQEGVKCLQVRAISNYVERRNRNNWNISLAVKNLNETAYLLLKDFGNILN